MIGIAFNWEGNQNLVLTKASLITGLSVFGEIVFKVFLGALNCKPQGTSDSMSTYC